MTYLAARNILETTGDEAAAWAVARQDVGLGAGVTCAQWVAFARAAIARDNANTASYKLAAGW